MAAPNWMIRSLRPDEWVLCRDLRIRAVTDAPDAFGADPQDVVRESDDYWRSFTAGFASDRHVLLVGFVEGHAIGTTYARLSDDGTGHIGAMWVDPLQRRGELGRQLLNSAIDWHVAHGVARLELWVTEGNEPAASLYRATDFTMTGVREPLREGSDLQRLLMQRVV